MYSVELGSKMVVPSDEFFGIFYMKTFAVNQIGAKTDHFGTYIYDTSKLLLQ